MLAIKRRELDDLIARGAGVVLVDHQAAGRERPSTLHSITCRWPRLVGPVTPLRFDEDAAAAVRWLLSARGDEDDGWQRCPECGGDGQQPDAGGRTGFGGRSVGQ